MKKATILYFTILLLGTNSQFLRFLQSSKNSYDYSSYSFTSINENLSGKTLSSTASDQSVVYITQSGISISNSNLNKASGDSSKTENSISQRRRINNDWWNSNNRSKRSKCYLCY